MFDQILINAGSKWEGEKILDGNEEKTARAFWAELSKCRSTGTSPFAKASSIWSQRSANRWRGIYLFVYYFMLPLYLPCEYWSCNGKLFFFDLILKKKKNCLCVWQALADPYFKGLSRVEREPSCQSISKLEFEFERRRLTKEDIRELIYREILEYHPQMLKDYMSGTEGNFLYPRSEIWCIANYTLCLLPILFWI